MLTLTSTSVQYGWHLTIVYYSSRLSLLQTDIIDQNTVGAWDVQRFQLLQAHQLAHSASGQLHLCWKLHASWQLIHSKMMIPQHGATLCPYKPSIEHNLL